MNELAWLFLCNHGVYNSNQHARDCSDHALADTTANIGGFKFRNATEELKFAHREWSGDATFLRSVPNRLPPVYVSSQCSEMFPDQAPADGSDGLGSSTTAFERF